MTKVMTCGSAVFEISYTSNGGTVLGAVRARHGNTLVEHTSAQADLFDRLSYIDGATATCGDNDLPSTVLISGVDKASGEVDQLYKIGYLPGSGFSEVSGPKL